MCRVVLMNKQGEKEIEKEYGLANYMEYLEEQLGGHGNGFALLKDNKVIKLEKGINLDVRDIANTIKKTKYDWCVFHTRLATIGERSDKNCHPFRRGDFILAMNGTENSVSFVSKIMDMTDTEAILDVITRYNLKLATLKNFNSIFMGFHKGKPFVVANNTSKIRVLKNNKTKAIVFASTFPADFKNNIFDTTECFLWNGGKLPLTLVKHKKRYYPITFFDDYIFDNGMYSQGYFKGFNQRRGA